MTAALELTDPFTAALGPHRGRRNLLHRNTDAGRAHARDLAANATLDELAWQLYSLPGVRRWRRRPASMNIPGTPANILNQAAGERWPDQLAALAPRWHAVTASLWRQTHESQREHFAKELTARELDILLAPLQRPDITAALLALPHTAKPKTPAELAPRLATAVEEQLTGQLAPRLARLLATRLMTPHADGADIIMRLIRMDWDAGARIEEGYDRLLAKHDEAAVIAAYEQVDWERCLLQAMVAPYRSGRPAPRPGSMSATKLLVRAGNAFAYPAVKTALDGDT